jgi:hypothetical protein
MLRKPLRSALFCGMVVLDLGSGVGYASVGTVQSTFTDSVPAAAAARSATPSVVARAVRGSHSSGRYVPKSFTYSLKIPSLDGVATKVKKAFDRKVNALIASELTFYARGALTEAQYNSHFSQDGSSTLGGKFVRDVPDEYLAWCHEGFRALTGSFDSSVYKERYASVVIKFSGFNAPCLSTGGLWVGYQTHRSLTIDVKTGKFKSLTDFTSNGAGEVTAGVKAWYAKESHEFLSKRPSVTKGMKVCDRPGNMITVSTAQKPCYSTPSVKSGPVAWLVQDKGLRLTFPAGEGPRNATVKWTRIPQLL